MKTCLLLQQSSGSTMSDIVVASTAPSLAQSLIEPRASMVQKPKSCCGAYIHFILHSLCLLCKCRLSPSTDDHHEVL
ncbi:unnamed protein product [Didymodactylos carnosus]|uniref:Uncharacterized protein n=1 Tax=Didymodactylos carnosus TaxID=1234261 RepID=A0A8S2FDQ5_9BILA|nr:unnamed protein product [Didymodactylos carnosus]CAF4229926.1 unnamed protein product [Didymodactylos carnosus]